MGPREHHAWRRCNQRHVRACILRAAIHRHQNYADMLRVASCESRLNPYAIGFGIHRGLFQFVWPGTWQTTPYGARDAFSAKWNALAAGWMWANGRRGEWACH
jgi:hypothetical protein